MTGIWLVTNKTQERFLRKKTVPFSFSGRGEPQHEGKAFTRKEMESLLKKMYAAMKAANGVGLSANQIGLPYQLFVAAVPDAQGRQKLYAVLNPKLEKAGLEKSTAEEGCLSVPGKFGEVTRPAQVTVSGCDKNGKAVKIKAWGLLARVFQHEIDHLNGALFIDKARNISEAAASKT